MARGNLTYLQVDKWRRKKKPQKSQRSVLYRKRGECFLFFLDPSTLICLQRRNPNKSRFMVRSQVYNKTGYVVKEFPVTICKTTRSLDEPDFFPPSALNFRLGRANRGYIDYGFCLHSHANMHPSSRGGSLCARPHDATRLSLLSDLSWVFDQVLLYREKLPNSVRTILAAKVAPGWRRTTVWSVFLYFVRPGILEPCRFGR